MALENSATTEDSVYKVVQQVNKDLPIYEVVPEQGKNRDSKILHRNLLLPCNHLPLEIPLKVASTKKRSKFKERTDTAIQEESSDEEDEWHYCYYSAQPQAAVQSQTDKRVPPKIDCYNTLEGPARGGVENTLLHLQHPVPQREEERVHDPEEVSSPSNAATSGDLPASSRSNPIGTGPDTTTALQRETSPKDIHI